VHPSPHSLPPTCPSSNSNSLSNSNSDSNSSSSSSPRPRSGSGSGCRPQTSCPEDPPQVLRTGEGCRRVKAADPPSP
jgi:hypothetical protein